MRFSISFSHAVASAIILMLAPSASAAVLAVCHGGDRAERRLTCIIDGDTGWENGVKWRYEAIDAPEMPAHAECKAEAHRAVQARDRLRQLMGGGYTINWSGDKGKLRAPACHHHAHGRS
jgi:endonuclease YncB( thermonuclease family)